MLGEVLFHEGDEHIYVWMQLGGLDHQVMRRLKEVHAKRPNMTYCILLADHFGINPNELLQLAGWPPLKVFDIKRASIDNLPTEAVE